MCISAYTHFYICMHAYIHTYINTYKHTYIHSYIHGQGYMSPELILMSYTSKATDVFAAGVVLFILLCGMPPFHSKSNRYVCIYVCIYCMYVCMYVWLNGTTFRSGRFWRRRPRDSTPWQVGSQREIYWYIHMCIHTWLLILKQEVTIHIHTIYF